MSRGPITRRPCAGCGRPFGAGPYAKWGPCCRWRHRGRKPKKYLWTPERDQIVRDRYDSRVRGRAAEIGLSLAWPGWVVKKRARDLGLAFPRGAWQPWTPAEEAFLESHAGTRHLHWMAKQLGRGLASVVMKLKRMSLSRRIRDGYTIRDLEMALGLDHRRLARLVEDGKLRAAHHPDYPRDRWIFSEKDVLTFLRRYPKAYRLDRVDQLWFLDLVFGGKVGNVDDERAA